MSNENEANDLILRDPNNPDIVWIEDEDGNWKPMNRWKLYGAFKLIEQALRELPAFQEVLGEEDPPN